MEELKNIKLDDTGLIVPYKNTAINKAILVNNIDNVYDLFKNYKKVYSSFYTNLHDNDKGEFLSLICLMKYRYLDEGLDLDLNKDFTEYKNNRKEYWTPIQRELQAYGIVKQLACIYASIIYCNHEYETRIIDVIEDILACNGLRDNGTYNKTLYEVAKNRASILLEYYQKESNKEKTLTKDKTYHTLY